MNFASIIATRRDGKRHTQAEIQALAKGAAEHSIPDYQLAAWLMAAYLNPLSDEETAWLTLAMADSGERLDLTGVPKPWVDKHSTGGVGDKTTLVVLPILAACGLTLVKMSGRGLGVTGGTVDKLESVPGFRLDLDADEMKRLALESGIALTGSSPSLAPADKALYALRDVTGTTESIPLIASSVLSKKIAGGAETIVLDVKCGSGAFMKTTQEARALAITLKQTAERCGVNCRLLITDMHQPLGAMIGNALEVREALNLLRTHPEADESTPIGRLAHLCYELSALTLEACGKAPDRDSARAQVMEVVNSGAAYQEAARWFASQGGDVEADLPVAPVQRTVTARSAGWISRIDAETIGLAAIQLGAGRQKKEDRIDHSVGIELHGCIGCRKEKGEPLFTLHASSEASADATVGRVMSAFTVAPFEVKPDKVIQTVV